MNKIKFDNATINITESDGLLQRSCKESRIVSVDVDSNLYDLLFNYSSGSYRTQDQWCNPKGECEVLQVMRINSSKILVEYILK